jgi:hypothetical protein
MVARYCHKPLRLPQPLRRNSLIEAREQRTRFAQSCSRCSQYLMWHSVAARLPALLAIARRGGPAQHVRRQDNHSATATGMGAARGAAYHAHEH